MELSQEDYNKLQDVLKENEDLKQQLSSYVSKIQSLKEIHAELKDRNVQLETIVKQLEAQLKDLSKRLDVMRADHARFLSNIKGTIGEAKSMLKEEKEKAENTDYMDIFSSFFKSKGK